MNRPLARGCVVTRDGRYGVVWADRGRDGLDVLPAMAPREPRRNDVPLDYDESAACGTPLACSIIRPVIFRVPADRQTVVGTVPGPTWLRIAAAILRELHSAAIVARWSGDRAHRSNARTRPVNMAAA